MICNNKNFCGGAGFLFGSFIFIALALGISSLNQNDAANAEYDRAPVYVRDAAPAADKDSSIIAVNFGSESSRPLAYLVQILFWLFLISPPIIVVLLLVIIGKMNKSDKS